MKLYDFAGSVSSFRVRIALNVKGIEYERASVDITRGEQLSTSYLSVNPVGVLPSLMVNGHTLTESLAIIEFLEEIHPRPALLPKGPEQRARVRAISLAIACGIQPLHPPRIASHLMSQGLTPQQVQDWSVHWIGTGMAAVERLLNSGGNSGKFCYGDAITMADVVLVPQIYAGKNKFKMEFADSCPTAWRVFQNCMAMPAFQNASPHVLVT